MIMLTPTCSECGKREVIYPYDVPMITFEFTDGTKYNVCKSCLAKMERKMQNEQSDILRKNNKRRRDKDN